MDFITQSRRDFLSVGAVGALSLPFLLQNEAFSTKILRKQRRCCKKCNSRLFTSECLLKNLKPKPYSPLEYRDHLMLLILQYLITIFKYNEEYGKVANKVTTIHSMTHGEHTNEEHIICSQDTNLVLR